MKYSRFLPALAVLFLPALLFAQSAVPQNTVITSDGPGEMVSTEKETTITFRTNVLVTGTNMRLTCDYLEVIVLRTGDPSATIGKFEKFRSMLATGNVHMNQGDREAACGRAEVLPDQEKVILSDNPVVVDHDQNTRFAGEKITMLKGQRRVLIEKPILTAPPVKDLGVDKELKPAAPASPAPAAPVSPTTETPKQP
jgi:lipopolysaccharide export system protein LptA